MNGKVNAVTLGLANLFTNKVASKLSAKIPAPYTLPTASADTKGGVKVGPGMQMYGEALGVIPEGEYELIETITLEESVTQIERTKEPDGTVYNFKKIYVHILTPKAESDGFLYSIVNGVLCAPMSNSITKTDSRGGIGQFAAYIQNGFSDFYGVGAINQGTSSSL